MVLSKGNKTTSTFPLFTTKTWVGCIFTTDVNFLLENIKMFWRVFFFCLNKGLHKLLCYVLFVHAVRAAPGLLRSLAEGFIYAGVILPLLLALTPQRQSAAAMRRTMAPSSSSRTGLPLNQLWQFPASTRNVSTPEPSSMPKINKQTNK